MEMFGISRRLQRYPPRPVGWMQGASDECHFSPREVSPRRVRGSSFSGRTVRMRGHLNVCEDEEDTCQREIFGRYEKVATDRRRRGAQREIFGHEDRMMRWPKAKAVGEEEVSSEATALKPLEQAGALQRSTRAAAALLAFSKATEANAGPTDDGNCVAVFGSHKRQLSAGPSGARGRRTCDGGEGFCWSAAPVASSSEAAVPRQWPENRSRRMARPGSPLRDQLIGGADLNGQSMEVRPSVEEDRLWSPRLWSPRSAADSAQMDVFGSPRRQKAAPPPRSQSPSANRLRARSGSPAGRMWCWLEAPAAVPGKVLCWPEPRVARPP